MEMLEENVKVTFGTAGKIFSGEPAAWKPLPRPSTAGRINPIAKIIDHTLLKPEARFEDIKNLCEEAVRYGFFSVCVNPCHVPLCAGILKKSSVKICSVAGFPLGASKAGLKALEAITAVSDGADEIDMVMNIGALKSGEPGIILEEVRSVRNAVPGKALKVILETCLLTDQEKKQACALSLEAGADFVKTSTGFSHDGATVRDVEILRQAVGGRIGIKASGGIRNLDSALRLVKAGATRIGTSASVAIVTGGF